MSLERRRVFEVVGGTLAAVHLGLTPAAAGPPPPVGPQKTLVFLMNFGSTTAELCPYTTPCPIGAADAATYKAPRHTAQEWQGLLNDYGPDFWALASYGQTDAQFTVVQNPLSLDGWWKPRHAAADYYVNGDLFKDLKSFAFVEDGLRGPIETLCALSFQVCTALGQFDRILLMSNKKARGGVTYGLNLPLTLRTRFGNFAYTATFVNESTTDSDALSVVMHEYGHQLGLPTHYGNCAAWYTPSFNGKLECLGAFDIMGSDGAWSQPTGYSRLTRSWIDPQSTLSYALNGTPFSTLTLIRPVSQAPSGVPNLIRLAFGSLDTPAYFGYLVECRRRVNGDQGIFPGSTGIYAEGLLVTSAHEASLLPIILPAAPPLHVVRPTSPPAADPSYAVLRPGESFTDPQRGLFIRLNGYAGDLAEPLCDVEVDYLAPPRTGPIVLWQNRVTPEPTPSVRAADIGLNHPAPPADAGGGVGSGQALPFEPVWPRHVNALFARAHTVGTLPAEDVTLKVSLSQPALITSACGTFADPDERELKLSFVDPVEGASAPLAFKPGRGSLGVVVHAAADPATGREASNAVATRFAFQFFPARRFSGSRFFRQRTHFTLQANDGCAAETTFHVAPRSVPPGWNVSVSAEVVALQPGERADVAVTVAPPAGAEAGAGAEIAIDVRQVEKTDRPAPPDPAAAPPPLDPLLQQNLDSVGSLQISARVVDDPAVVRLFCTRPRRRGGPVVVRGFVSPAAPNSVVMLEYTSPGGAVETRFATTDGRGVFTDRFLSRGTRFSHVQAFWPGDRSHAPAESRRSPL